jgi:hypothetical protein
MELCLLCSGFKKWCNHMVKFESQLKMPSKKASKHWAKQSPRDDAGKFQKRIWFKETAADSDSEYECPPESTPDTSDESDLDDCVEEDMAAQNLLKFYNTFQRPNSHVSLPI